MSSACIQPSSTRALLLFLAFFAGCCAQAQQTIRVPSDYPTIQGAIDNSPNGTTILVSPGTYYENIDFHGKAVALQANGASGSAVLDGSAFRNTPVVSFRSGEGRSSILDGFTVQNGSPATSFLSAGGILILNASPTVRNSMIVQNKECGIASYYSSPLIEHNVISGTTHDLTSSGCDIYDPASELSEANFFVTGTGLFVYGFLPGSPETAIDGNTVLENIGYGVSVAGILLVNSGPAVISNNVINGNSSHEAPGSGLEVRGDSEPFIVQNVIFNNTINETGDYHEGRNLGAGINIGVGGAGANDSFGTAPAYITNNTVAFNQVIGENGTADGGTQVDLVAPFANVTVANNVMVGTDGDSPFDCFADGVASPEPTLTHNDAFTYGGTASYSGGCADALGRGGNISADPLFLAKGATEPSALSLQLQSPAVDTGDNSAPGLGSLDFLGAARIQNAKGLPTSIIDMGAYEHAGVPKAPPSPEFSLTATPTTASVSMTTAATLVVQVTPNSSLSGQVQFACPSLPAGLVCTFSPVSVPMQGGISQTVQLVISKAATANTASAIIQRRKGTRPAGSGAGETLGMAMPLFFLRKRKQAGPWAAIARCGWLLLLLGCGVHVGPGEPTQTPVTILATSTAGIAHQVLVSIMVSN